MQEFDVAIIGSGFSGLSALKIALNKGLRTVLISKDLGASQYFSGAFDLIDPRILKSKLYCDSYSLPQSLTQFCEANPHHYYTQHFQNFNSAPDVLLQEMQSVLAYYQIPFVGDGKEGVWAIGSTGLLKPTAFAWQTQALTAQQWQKAKRILVLGFEGVFEYSAQSVAQELQNQMQNVEWKSLSGFELMPASPYVSLLRAFQSEVQFQSLCEVVRHNLKTYDLLIVPPVLQEKMRQRFADEFQGRVCEMLSVLPSVAGQRLQSVIHESLQKKNLMQIKGSVNRVLLAHNQNLQEVHVQTDQGVVDVRAKKWVLATGKFLGGGLQHKTNGFCEPLLNLPLVIDQNQLVPQTHMTQLIHKDPSQSQAFLKVGVRPFSQDLPQNVSVCGHLLAGFDFTREHCGFGLSVASAQNTL